MERPKIQFAAVVITVLLANFGVSRVADQPSDSSTNVLRGLSIIGEDGLLSRDAPEPIYNLLTEIVLDNIPHHFEDESDWGMTTEVWDGLKIHREGLQIKTKRRKKEVKHGRWRRYTVDLVEPEDRFNVRIDNWRNTADGQFTFDAHVEAQLRAHARLANWQRGVQLISISTDANATVAMRLTCQVGLGLELTQIPPAVALEPKIVDADLRLVSFRVHRVSKVGGEVAEQLGRAMESVLKRKLEDNERKLIDKANRQIAKHEDKLRLSVQELVAKQWSKIKPEMSKKTDELELQPPLAP